MSFVSDGENAGKGIDALRPEKLFEAAEKKEPGIVAKYTEAVKKVIEEKKK